MADTHVIDKFLECDVITDEEKADFRDIHNIKAGSLLKRIIRKGPSVCRKAVSALESLEYEIHCNIQQIIAQQTGMLDKKSFLYPHKQSLVGVGFILSVFLSPICGHDVVHTWIFSENLYSPYSIPEDLNLEFPY